MRGSGQICEQEVQTLASLGELCSLIELLFNFLVLLIGCKRDHNSNEERRKEARNHLVNINRFGEVEDLAPEER